MHFLKTVLYIEDKPVRIEYVIKKIRIAAMRRQSNSRSCILPKATHFFAPFHISYLSFRVKVLRSKRKPKMFWYWTDSFSEERRD